MVTVKSVFTVEDEGKEVFQVFLDNGKTYINDTERAKVPEVGSIFTNMEAFYGYVEG